MPRDSKFMHARNVREKHENEPAFVSSPPKDSTPPPRHCPAQKAATSTRSREAMGEDTS